MPAARGAGAAAPAVTLANGSAGDQQYTDPFGGGNANATTTRAAPTSTAAPPSATAPPASSAPATSPPATTAPAPSTAAAPTTATTPAAPATPQPTATIAGGASLSTLPYTGYDAWIAAGFGAVMLGTGLTLRLRTRHR